MEDTLPNLNQFSRIFYGRGYTVSLEACGVWASKIMSIYCFRQMCSAYHPEFEESEVGDKCRHLRFLIRCIDRDAARNFDLGPKRRFLRRGYSELVVTSDVSVNTIKMSWKYFRIYLFVLDNSEYYFVRDVDVYQGKDT